MKGVGTGMCFLPGVVFQAGLCLFVGGDYSQGHLAKMTGSYERKGLPPTI